MDPTSRFAELVAMPSEEVRFDEIATLIGCAFEPSADPAAVTDWLDDVARSCEGTFESVLDVLFGSGRLVGNRADYGDPHNSYLHRVVERGLGIPITLSVCAMEVGRRVGVEVHGIGLPGHFVVESGGVFADPFHRGVRLGFDDLETHWRRGIGGRRPLDARFLRPVTPRALALRMLNNLKNGFVAADDASALSVLVRLRSAYPELRAERDEYRRWMRHWN